MLTTAQLATLRTAIDADPALASQPNNADGHFTIAGVLNKPSNPAFTVWRTAVPIDEIMSNGFVWTSVDGMTAGKARIWDWMSRLGAINPSKANIRQGLADAFGAGTAMGLSILPHLKRIATRAEQLLATGTGTDATPAVMGWEGLLTYQDIEEARR